MQHNQRGVAVSDRLTSSRSRAGARDHTREDDQRAENRINVLLYACQAVPEFWRECRCELGLSEDAYLRRVLVDGRQERPDFLVYEGGVPTCWIESELADRNDQQLGDYADKPLDPPRVLSLVGPAANREGGPSLEAIVGLAARVAGDVRPSNPPAAEVLEFLTELIREHIRPSRLRTRKRDIPERLRVAWFERAAGPLLDLMGEDTVVNATKQAVSLSLQLRRGLKDTNSCPASGPMRRLRRVEKRRISGSS
jgi:hypothetical protein